MREDVNTEQLGECQKIVDTEKCVKDIPTDVSYHKYMQVVRENEELKETIVKLVKKLNECKFFE